MGSSPTDETAEVEDFATETQSDLGGQPFIYDLSLLPADCAVRPFAVCLLVRRLLAFDSSICLQDQTQSDFEARRLERKTTAKFRY
jgi:hypothetical protein